MLKFSLWVCCIRFVVVLGLVTVALFGAGCASMTSDSVYSVMVNSNPSGADVLIKNQKVL